jgi:hypothetical protein
MDGQDLICCDIVCLLVLLELSTKDDADPQIRGNINIKSCYLSGCLVLLS